MEGEGKVRRKQEKERAYRSIAQEVVINQRGGSQICPGATPCRTAAVFPPQRDCDNHRLEPTPQRHKISPVPPC